jgi:Ca2+-binding EF-hand superfamily protein
MDTDGDGLVSVKEHAAGAKAMFERMDANHDGNVTAAEMDAAHAMMMKRVGGMHGAHPMPGKGMGPGMPAGGMMGMMDSNRDGAITAQEHAAHAKAMFERMDADRDGKVTAGELTVGHETMTKEVRIVHRGPGMPGMGMDSEMGAGMGSGMSSADRISKMDRNGDGRLSAAEHAAGAQAMFNAADTNKDGKLSTAERMAHHGAMMKHGMHPGNAMDEDKDKEED